MENEKTIELAESNNIFVLENEIEKQLEINNLNKLNKNEEYSENNEKLIELQQKIFRNNETILYLNNVMDSFYKINFPSIYERNGTLQETFPQIKSAGSPGLYYSALSFCITNNIVYLMTKENNNFEYVDCDGIDFKYNGVEGDFKINFNKECCWTGNGCSTKRGMMVLIKILLNRDAILGNKKYIKSLCVICIDAQYINSERTSGNSDRAILRIMKENYDKIIPIVGGIRCASKYIHPIFIPVNYNNFK
jgi:hypothetical protein